MDFIRLPDKNISLEVLNCINVFFGYTASSNLMATCVTLTDLTDWSKPRNFGQEDGKGIQILRNTNLNFDLYYRLYIIS